MIGEPSDEKARLRDEIARLRRKVRRYQWVFGRQWLAGKFLVRLFVGTSLATAVQAWFDALKSGKGHFPVTETGTVVAAFLRRMSRAAIVGVLIAAVPSVLLFWQNVLIRDQNRYFREQTSNLVAQLNLQKTQYDNQRRTEVTEILFEFTEEFSTAVDGSAVSERIAKHNSRTRAEAFKEFVGMERERGNMVDVSGAMLNEINIADVDLSRVVSSRETRFQGSSLSGILFSSAYFEDGDFEGVLFRDSRFLNTTFYGVRFFRARVFNCEFLYDSRSPLLTNITKGRRYEGPELNPYGVIFGDFHQGVFRDCTFSNAVLNSYSLSDGVRARGYISDSKFLTCDFTGEFGDTSFSYCTFDGVRFLGGSESESPFVGAVVRGGSVSMSEADCARSELVNTVFQEVDLSGLPLGCKPLFEPLLDNGSLRNCKLPDSW